MDEAPFATPRYRSMRYVTLSSAGASVPRRCACCGGAPSTLVEARRSRGLFLLVAVVQTTFTFKVPYCAPCAAHAKAFHGASAAALRMPALFLGAISFVLALMLSDLAGLPGGQVVAAIVGAPAVVVGVLIFWRRRQRVAALANMPGYHASCGPAVTVDRFDELTVTLCCVDPEFGRLLAEANPAIRPAGV
jgi:hypothetical protein